MNVLFLSLVEINTLQNHNIYTDLLRTFCKHGHNVYVLSATDSKSQKDRIIHEFNSIIVKVWTGRIQKVNLIEKGLNTVLLANRYTTAIKKHFSNIHFDLVLYSTPPITVAGPVEYIKRRDNAVTYLLLKDIFPQNAVDIGLIKNKGIIYRYFRNEEKKLYHESDYIGCMSQANVKYLLLHNPELKKEKVEVNPNSIEPIDMSVSLDKRSQLRKRYNIPENKVVFVYGGNLGKPQDIPFIIDCLNAVDSTRNDTKQFDDIYFLLIGSGTDYPKLDNYIRKKKPNNIQLIPNLPKDEYDMMIGSCDVGMIFLDDRFTIPNFPSRLLSYAAAKMPVLCVTDTNTDIGKMVVDNRFGWWCESKDTTDVLNCIKYVYSLLKNGICDEMGSKAYNYLFENWSSEHSYNIILKHFVS